MDGGRVLTIEARAQSFLYHQVRNMVGALHEAGRGAIDASDVARMLEARDRSVAPAMAPADGLYLLDVDVDFSGTTADGFHWVDGADGGAGGGPVGRAQVSFLAAQPPVTAGLL